MWTQLPSASDHASLAPNVSTSCMTWISSNVSFWMVRRRPALLQLAHPVPHMKNAKLKLQLSQQLLHQPQLHQLLHQQHQRQLRHHYLPFQVQLSFEHNNFIMRPEWHKSLINWYFSRPMHNLCVQQAGWAVRLWIFLDQCANMASGQRWMCCSGWHSARDLLYKWECPPLQFDG